MSVTLYDDALIKKFTSLLKDDRIKIMAPEETTEYFQQLLAEQKDKPIKIVFEDDVKVAINGNDIEIRRKLSDIETEKLLIDKRHLT